MVFHKTKSYPSSKAFLSGVFITLYEVVCAADIRVVGLVTSPRKAHGGVNKQRETPPSGT